MNFEYSNIKFDRNPSSRSRVVPIGHTNRHDEPKLSLLANFTKAPLNVNYVKKGRALHVLASKAFRGTRGIAPLILNLDTTRK